MEIDIRNKEYEDHCSVCDSQLENCYGQFFGAIVPLNDWCRALYIDDKIICIQCMQFIAEEMLTMSRLSIILEKKYTEERQEEAKRREIMGIKIKQKIAKSLRWEVFKRDDFRCKWCGTRDKLCCDHIIPESKGGETTLENLQTLCRTCNSRKGINIYAEGEKYIPGLSDNPFSAYKRSKSATD